MIDTIVYITVAKFVFFFLAVNELPVLKADAIKYIMTFRSLLPNELITTVLPLLVSQMHR